MASAWFRPDEPTDDRVIGCAFSFARSRVRAFNGSMFWLGQRAARARLDGGERRGHMQPNTPRRKNARTRERANARTKTRKPQGNARDSISALLIRFASMRSRRTASNQ